MQNRISVDGWDAVQPVTFEFSYQTTSSQDSGRPMSGKAAISPLFTVEAYDVEYQDLTINQAKTLLQKLVQRPSKPFFQLHYFSPYYGYWRTDQFYVGEGSLKVRSLKEGEEEISSITCSFIGRNKLC